MIGYIWENAFHSKAEIQPSIHWKDKSEIEGLVATNSHGANYGISVPALPDSYFTKQLLNWAPYDLIYATLHIYGIAVHVGVKQFSVVNCFVSCMQELLDLVANSGSMAPSELAARKEEMKRQHKRHLADFDSLTKQVSFEIFLIIEYSW